MSTFYKSHRREPEVTFQVAAVLEKGLPIDGEKKWPTRRISKGKASTLFPIILCSVELSEAGSPLTTATRQTNSVDHPQCSHSMSFTPPCSSNGINSGVIRHHARSLAQTILLHTPRCHLFHPALPSHPLLLLQRERVYRIRWCTLKTLVRHKSMYPRARFGRADMLGVIPDMKNEIPDSAISKPQNTVYP